MKTRPIEMGVALEDRTWTTEVVDIPADTSDADIEAVARAEIRNIEVVGSWVYNTMEDSVPIPDCPHCSGQMELSGTEGRFNCFGCGYEGPA